MLDPFNPVLRSTGVVIIVIMLQLLLGLGVFQLTGSGSVSQFQSGYNDWLLKGFYGQEKNSAFSYRWTAKEASLLLPQVALNNSATFWLLAPRPASPAGSNQKVVVNVRVEGQPVAQLEIDPQEIAPHPYTIQWKAFSLFPTVEVAFETPAAFRPPGDSRQLGLMLAAVEVEAAKGPFGLILPSLFTAVIYFLVTLLISWLFLRKFWQRPIRARWASLVVALLLPSLVLFILPLPLLLSLACLTFCGLLFQRVRYNVAKGLSHDNLIAVLLFALAMIIYAATTPDQLVGTNDGSHFALVKAIGEQGKFEIGSYLDYTMRTDYASPQPYRYYADRPPGTAWLAAPLYSLAKLSASTALLAPKIPLFALFSQPLSFLWLGLNWVMLLPVLCGALSAVLLYKLARYLGASQAGAVLAACYLAFATLEWKYSTLLYSHVPGSTFILLGLYLCLTAHKRPARMIFGLGALGYSVAVDYINLLPAGAILIYLGWQSLPALLPGRKKLELFRPKRNYRFIALCLVVFGLPLLALAVYQALCFGSPFSTSYAYSGKWLWARQFSTTFDRPPWEGLIPLLFGWWPIAGLNDPAVMRGLFSLSPGLLLGLWGLAYWWKNRRDLLALWAAIIIPVSLVMGMHHTYWGGGDFDARYLLVTIPFICLGVALWWDRFVAKLSGPARFLLKLLFGGVFLYSLLANLLHLYLDYPQRLFRWAGLATPPDWGLAASQRNSLTPLQPVNPQTLMLALFIAGVLMLGRYVKDSRHT